MANIVNTPPILDDEQRELDGILDRVLNEQTRDELIETPLLQGQESPLSTLIPVFIDWETYMDDEVRLGKMTLRQYLTAVREKAGPLPDALSIVIGNENTPRAFFSPEIAQVAGLETYPQRLFDVLRDLSQDPKYVMVAFNGAFDFRVNTILCGLPFPTNAWCAMEGAMAAWPELPGGYSLDNCSRRLGIPKAKRKIKLDLQFVGRLRKELRRTRSTVRTVDLPEEVLQGFVQVCKLYNIELKDTLDLKTLYQIYASYNVQDTICLREVYLRQIGRISPREQKVGLRTHRQRKWTLKVDPERLEALITSLEQAAVEAEQRAGEFLSEEQAKLIFNKNENGVVRSIRYQKLRAIVNDSLRDSEEEFTSTSLKKINPTLLAKNQTVGAVLEQTTRVGKMKSHQRRAEVFTGVDTADVELGYARATTFRFSSPSVGRGINLHNCPKHDVAIAKPVRETYRLPDGYCFVRVDEANVEYRVEGLITQCKTVLDMFDPAHGGNPAADPYVEGWRAMTGVVVKGKKDPVRQVSKSAILGLGFMMQVLGYSKVILKLISDGRSSVEQLQNLISTNGWGTPPRRIVDKVVQMLGCDPIVAIAAYHIHRLFNIAHREYGETANWLLDVVTDVGTCVAGPQGRDAAKRKIEAAYRSTKAPNRDLIGLEIDDDPLPQYPSIRVRCGFWDKTLMWREPHVRKVDFAGGADTAKLTIMKSTGLPKPFTIQLAIENVVQAAARNTMCDCLEQLEAKGFPDHIHIHDEALLIVPQQREAILSARQAILDVMGPGHKMPWTWAVYVHEHEISVTKSLWESEYDIDPAKGRRWQRIINNEPGCLDDLP